MLRRSGDIQDISAFFIAKITLFRVPFITERVMPFAVLVGAMFCYLNLSRRLELVVARAAGISAWQFIAPALVIALADRRSSMTTIYNPISAILREQSTRLEAELFGVDTGFRDATSGFWLRQRSDEGQAIINAKIEPPARNSTGRRDRFPVRRVRALPRPHRGQERDAGAGYWRLEDARSYVSGVAPSEREQFRFKTTLTPAQVGESFANSRNRAVLELSSYIELAEKPVWPPPDTGCNIISCWRSHFTSRRWCCWPPRSACAFSAWAACRRWCSAASRQGFLLYVLAKITGDLSKAGMMPPMVGGGAAGADRRRSPDLSRSCTRRTGDGRVPASLLLVASRSAAVRSAACCACGRRLLAGWPPAVRRRLRSF